MRIQPLVFLLLATVTAAPAEVTVIVSSEAELVALDGDGMRDVFLGKRSLIAGHQQAELLIQEDERKQEEFVRRYVGITPSQFRTYWKKMVFTGQGKAPTAMSDDQQVVDYVRTHRFAVGYIDAASPHDGVKLVPSAKMAQ